MDNLVTLKFQIIKISGGSKGGQGIQGPSIEIQKKGKFYFKKG